MNPTVVVIIPTWNRVGDLTRCLSALEHQSVRPTRIIIAGKESDRKLREWYQHRESIFTQVSIHLVLSPESANVVQQQNRALLETTEDIVALTDDDAEPETDWIEKLLKHFADPKVGGVGGRDWQPIERGNKDPVGILHWYGRLIGNHHLGYGPARPVHVLKGVNCAYRGDVLRTIRFDQRMRGTGTVINWELAIGFAFIRRGYQLIYDPAVSVKHHIADRKDGDTNQRGIFEAQSYFDNTYNEVLAIYDHLSPTRRLFFQVWSELIGTAGNPGVVQLLRTLIRSRYSRKAAWPRYRTAVAARRNAISAIRHGTFTKARNDQLFHKRSRP